MSVEKHFYDFRKAKNHISVLSRMYISVKLSPSILHSRMDTFQFK